MPDFHGRNWDYGREWSRHHGSLRQHQQLGLRFGDDAVSHGGQCNVGNVRVFVSHRTLDEPQGTIPDISVSVEDALRFDDGFDIDYVLPESQSDSVACDIPAWMRGLGMVSSLLMQSTTRDCFIGDLNERYALICKSQGQRVATCWLRREVFHSVFSLILDAVKRVSGLKKLYRQAE